MVWVQILINIKSLGFEYYGIEFSRFAVDKIILSSDLKNFIVEGDFTKDLFFPDKKFEIILDRASLTCNPTSKIINSIELIKEKLASKVAISLGIDWYSTEHSGFTKIGNTIRR